MELKQMEKYKKSYAKVNIFLKVTGKRNGYHELVSRFVKINNLWDEIFFIKTDKKCFDITGNFSCSLEKNTIYKIYKLIENMPNVKSFFEKYSVKVCKNIPEFAGLGGGSSNAAVFLLMVNEYCRLGLSKDSMAKIGVKVGADIPFFIYEYNSANVTGIGEVVKEFKEEALKIEVFTPLIKCDTSEIFKIFREKFYKEISFNKKMIW